MECAHCHHASAPGAKFCEQCGAVLAVTCVACGTTLSPSAKFCPECGRAAAPVGPRADATALSSAAEGERKQVTVLFADLKGSMELLADRDPEEARRLLDAVLERMLEAVHTVNQVMGDGTMALFGAPLAHEDHAGRGQAAAVTAEPGVGETRLVFELVQSLGIRDWRVLESTSLSYERTTSYLPIAVTPIRA
jgi:class 3 adenylate cyclase